MSGEFEPGWLRASTALFYFAPFWRIAKAGVANSIELGASDWAPLTASVKFRKKFAAADAERAGSGEELLGGQASQAEFNFGILMRVETEDVRHFINSQTFGNPMLHDVSPDGDVNAIWRHSSARSVSCIGAFGTPCTNGAIGRAHT